MSNPYLQVGHCQQYGDERDYCPRRKADRNACVKCGYIRWVQRNYLVKVEEPSKEKQDK